MASKSPWLPGAKKIKLNVSGLSSADLAEVRELVDRKRKTAAESSASSSSTALPSASAFLTSASSALPLAAPTQPLGQTSKSKKQPPTAAQPSRTLRSASQRQPPADDATAHSDGATAPADQMQIDPEPRATAPTDCIVIIDNVVGVNRKGLEPELCRNATWLRPVSVDVMPSGGLRIKCKSPADAQRLLNRDGFAADAFNGPFTIHRPGERDPTRPTSERLKRELRSVLTSRLPAQYDAADLRVLLSPDYVEEIRDFPKAIENRAPKRCVVFKTQEQADDALANGLKFLNRTIHVEPLRAPVLPAFCYKDSKPGHATVDCTSPHFVCRKCSDHHPSNTCNVPPEQAKCPNCDGSHYATYRGCPIFRAAVKSEIEKRAARVAAKLEKRNRRRRPVPPSRPAVPRSENPAPVVPGLSFAAAATAHDPQPQPPQPRPSTVLASLPPRHNSPSTSAPHPTEFAQLFALMLSLKDEVTASRNELIEVKTRLKKFENIVTRLRERNDMHDINDDSDMSDIETTSNAFPDQQQQHV
jgi:hypothetical protein